MKILRSLAIWSFLSAAMFAQKGNPVPLIDQPLSPASVPLHSPGFTLTVNGAGFAAGAAIYWNGSIRPTTAVSGTSLQTQISAGDVANPGTVWVTVGNPA